MTDHSLKPRPPLFPDSAIRPLGTLHLTLGVMSLTTRDRLDEATSFLNSLDIEQILRDATRNGADISQQQRSSAEEEENSLAPISVSLQSLYALPKAEAATVLYAKPVDPTSRLYPLGVKLRERFVEAGLIQPDYLKTKPRKGSKVTDNKTSRNGAPEQAEIPKPKLRPLLLHATIVNTVYARGGNSAQNRGKDRRRGGPLTFDARDMLTHHHDFYTDDTCVEAKKHDISDSSFLEDAKSDRSSESNDESSSTSTQEDAHPSRTVQQITPETADSEKFPFVWARNFHIEKVCICEMGAKAVVHGDGDPLGARLGQKYRVVAERSLPSF
jgi:activating signal cointegrator complex subunit 1